MKELKVYKSYIYTLVNNRFITIRFWNTFGSQTNPCEGIINHVFIKIFKKKYYIDWNKYYDTNI